MCEYCAVDGSCIHGSQAGVPSKDCACLLAGPTECPGCGHDCVLWYSLLRIPDHPELADVLSESTPPVRYPATREAVVKFLSGDGVTSPEARSWAVQRLSPGPFLDPGEVIAALASPIQYSAGPSGPVVHRVATGEIAVGTRLAIGDGQRVVLVNRAGKALDVLPEGSTTISRDSAPHVAAGSRPPAAGFARSALAAEPVFVHAQDLPLRIQLVAPVQDYPLAKVDGQATVRPGAPDRFLSLFHPPFPDVDATTACQVAERAVSDGIRQAIAHRTLSDLKSQPGVLDEGFRSAASAVGLVTIAVRFDAVEKASPQDVASQRMAQIAAMPNLPPEVLAQIQARIASPRPAPSVPRGPESATSPSGTSAAAPVACPNCRAPNPSNGKFCGNCGRPLSVKPNCPNCGQPLNAGVKFCGNCGARTA